MFDLEALSFRAHLALRKLPLGSLGQLEHHSCETPITEVTLHKSASVAERSHDAAGKANVIVDGISEPLLGPRYRLDAHVTEQELDLLKLTTCLVTQTRTSLLRSCGATPRGRISNIPPSQRPRSLSD